MKMEDVMRLCTELEQHAARVLGTMRKEVLDRRELQKKIKMRVFNANVTSDG